jgi:hypothetical protein
LLAICLLIVFAQGKHYSLMLRWTGGSRARADAQLRSRAVQQPTAAPPPAHVAVAPMPPYPPPRAPPAAAAAADHREGTGVEAAAGRSLDSKALRRVKRRAAHERAGDTTAVVKTRNRQQRAKADAPVRMSDAQERAAAVVSLSRRSAMLATTHVMAGPAAPRLGIVGTSAVALEAFAQGPARASMPECADAWMGGHEAAWHEPALAMSPWPARDQPPAAPGDVVFFDDSFV